MSFRQIVMYGIAVYWYFAMGYLILMIMFPSCLNLKGEVQTLQKALDVLTKASVESILHRLLNFMARPLTEFNKYEALEMTEELQNAAHDRKHPKERYYRVVYQTIREKMEVPPVQFRALSLRLLGDKDQKRVSDIVSKVGKHFYATTTSACSTDAEIFDPGSWCHTSMDECPLLLL